jgi:hypothetical protein
MPSNERNRPPAPVVAAVVIYALYAGVILISAVVLAIAGARALALLGLVALLPGSVALGLWQGNRGARVGAMVWGIPSVVVSLVMVLLLVVPESSRAWFTPDEPEEFGFVDEDGEGEDDERVAGHG